MDVINYSDARKGLMDVMDRVVETHRPVLIVRPMAEAVVVVSLADWNALEATTHLLSTLTNAGRLGEAVAELDAGGDDRGSPGRA